MENVIMQNAYEKAIENIINRSMNVPEKLTIHELKIYLDGYTDCQFDILAILERMAGDYKDGGNG